MVAVFWVIVLLAVLIAVFYYRWESEQIEKAENEFRGDFGEADTEWFLEIKEEDHP